MTLDIKLARRFFDDLKGKELLAATLSGFHGRVALVSSFGAESAVLLHMAAKINPDVPVLVVDTGKLFWQTRYYRAKLVDQLGLSNVHILRPSAGKIAHHDYDGGLHLRDADQCCHIRKTTPLLSALSEYEVWISGRKRYHGGTRKDLPAVSIVDGKLKVEPLAEMQHEDIEAYMTAHDLPRHPLTERGYFSIGCQPCTSKGGDCADPRAGRWAGSDKSECGIHWDENGQPVRG